MGNAGGKIGEVAPDGNIVWEWEYDGGRMHHDHLKLPNGNVLLLLRETKTYAEAVAAGTMAMGMPGVADFPLSVGGDCLVHCIAPRRFSCPMRAAGDAGGFALRPYCAVS